MSDTSPLVSHSVHSKLLEQAIPDWLTDATPQRRQQIKTSDAPMPDGYQRASPQQRKALNDSVVASFSAQTRLDKAMSALQDIDTFAAPLLINALKKQFNVQLDVNKTFLVLRKAVEVGIFAIDVGSFEVLKLPLLQAALHNFEAWECLPGAFHESSGFLLETSIPGTFEAATPALTVQQFTGLCRSLDIGAKYQTYLKDYLHPADAVADRVFRDTFIAAQKTALRAAAEMALLKKDIEPGDYTMLLAVIEGEIHPRQGNKEVWFCDLVLMKHRMTGCVFFSICEKYRYTDELILYIPNDPHHPLKRYTYSELEAQFKQQFTARDGYAPDDPSPTAYQRFFSQFVAYADRAYYFNQFTVDAKGASVSQSLAPYVPLLNEGLNGINPFSIFNGIKELPPAAPSPKRPEPDPFLAPGGIPRKGAAVWTENIDLWPYLFEQHRDKVLADARSHAVPTADVDARVRSEKFSGLLNIGMLVLTGVSMFVPVLGEVMMGVMAGQLLEETLEGAVEWGEGDRKAAKAHLVDVAENLALLAVMAGAGKGLAKLTAVKAEPLIERLEPVTGADGKARLWKPDLGRYESPVDLEGSGGPNAQGQHQLDGRTYIRQAGKVYETTWDESLNRWRIKHPDDPQAYRPLLSHNGAGAWRHTLERPLTWDRLTLLRRMGHVTEAFSDQQLINIADISGVSDNVLRKIHMDNLPPPPEWVDTLQLFDAERNVEPTIRQLATGESIDARYLSVLPLVTELPRWPTGRVLQVFEEQGLTGPSVKYGAERLLAGAKSKPPIRISRADVLNGELPDRVLAALNESEIVGLLGGEPARVRATRPGELRKQLADFARTRRPTLFENLYQGMATPAPDVAKLQRLHPGLSHAAAQTVLAQANAEQLTQLHTTGRVPLTLQEQARWHVQQGRLSRAYTGLHMEHMGSADSRRLALQALAKLPGWSDHVRLEIREGHVEGPLLEAIGSETAASRKYLVKKGPYYQAFNDRGETLNSLPRYGDNFFEALMHALPDEARRALGVPETGQNRALRRAIIDYAMEHRTELAWRLEQHGGKPAKSMPPTRLKDGRMGYLASGDGPGMDAHLVTRVQNVYPGLTDQQANGYLLKLRRAGQTDAQIYGHLQARLSEWQTLESTLDQWLHPSSGGVDNSLFGGRTVVENIKASWRNAPLVDDDPSLARLEIIHLGSLPPITADFSHVRDLTLMASGPNELLKQFTNVEKLQLVVRSDESAALFEVISGMQRLASLHISASPTAELLSNLSRLTRLEELNLVSTGHFGEGFDNAAFDFRAFSNLRRLEVIEPRLTEWPTGLLELPRLERLNLRRTGIDKLPAGIKRHEKLLAGLSLDWSKFPRDVFKPVYEYISSLPTHLIDAEEMVSDYCKGELLRVSGYNFDVLYNKFAEQWQGAQARFDAIEALSSQHEELEQTLTEWTQTPSAWELEASDNMASMARTARQSKAVSLRTCWRNGLFQRYGSTTGLANLDAMYARSVHSTELELPFWQMDPFPRLPAEGFAHVQTLRLTWLQSPVAPLLEFVRGFSGLTTLDLSSSGLTELPLATGDLTALEHLNLRNSPLTHLDVGDLSRLQSLDLRGTELQAWPAGAEDLAQLTWLDLRDTRITKIPPTALSRDSVVISANLTDVPLTPEAQTALTVAQRRIEQASGLASGTLSRFARQAVPENFPPTENGISLSYYLLPLLPAETAEIPQSLEQRLRRLCPSLNADEPGQWIEQMRVKGTTDVQLHERIDGWNRTHEVLTRQLNDWLYIRETRGPGWIQSAHNRHLAAQRIMGCWRKGLLVDGTTVEELDLNGLQLGDLPELAITFPHVETLDLTGTRLSEQGSNGFLRAFGELRTLVLNGNDLQALPESVQGMSTLERLELSANDIADPQTLYRSLAANERLRYLDLGFNLLEAFDATRLPQLEALDLRNNRLTAWPEGALRITRLRNLNLSSNDLTSIPTEALDGSHDLLMSGIDVSDNFDLSRDSLERLRDYARRHGRSGALGLPNADIDLMIENLDSDIDSDSAPESVEPDEDLSEQPFMSELREPWFETIEPEALVERQALWDQLEAEPDHEAFFHLLMRLQDTQEFRVARADLTRRVWNVLNAAASDTELRQTLFGLSNTHGTCVDGRILTFSGLEIKVYEHNALLDIDPANLEQKGAALLKLSRQLFRLDRVEELAAKAPAHRHDAAEARLEYRIGLKDALELPGQPNNMAFGRPITGKTLADAIDAVQRAEKSDLFYEELISRPYWVQYLKEKYPLEFQALEKNAAEKNNRLEDDHPDIASSAYSEALESLGIELTIERNQKLIELSRRETGEIAPASTGELQPGPSRAPLPPR
ncbi:NEL-type E3 ubiquitin ligase domain-containing protein [Pseudomonas baetica]|uniref:NEL-type E3 ubiquitin ligase domain-containing protein n=1 Tax=Pseudomonas baetica TaxID=674054 RepID=UPI003EE830DE